MSKAKKADMVKVGIIQFNKTELKGFSEAKFKKVYKSTCEKYNVDINQAYEAVTGKAPKSK